MLAIGLQNSFCRIFCCCWNGGGSSYTEPPVSTISPQTGCCIVFAVSCFLIKTERFYTKVFASQKSLRLRRPCNVWINFSFSFRQTILVLQQNCFMGGCVWRSRFYFFFVFFVGRLHNYHIFIFNIFSRKKSKEINYSFCKNEKNICLRQRFEIKIILHFVLQKTKKSKSGFAAPHHKQNNPAV